MDTFKTLQRFDGKFGENKESNIIWYMIVASNLMNSIGWWWRCSKKRWYIFHLRVEIDWITELASLQGRW